jgi:predicted DNA-binding protein YlxM (UPF0122 family)
MIMRQQAHSKDKITRFSLDMSEEQHIHLKMLATKHKMTMREYIFEALAFKEAAEEKNKKKETSIDMDNETFRKGLKRIRKEHYQLAQNLSKR